MKRKITAIMLAIIMTVALFPALPVYAAATTITPGGGNQNGTGWTWVASTKTLTLSGSTDISADEITFSGAFNSGSVIIKFSGYTGATPTINFSNVTITNGTVGDPCYGSAIVIENYKDIILNFTGTNNIYGRDINNDNGGNGIDCSNFGSLTINGSVNFFGGNSTGTNSNDHGGQGIKNYNGDIIINATGPINIVSGNSDADGAGTCVYTNKNFTINGSEAVNITGGNSAAGGAFYCIYANNVTLNNSNTTIRAGNGAGDTGYGGAALYVPGSVTINKSATITGGDFNGAGTASNCGGGNGINCKGTVSINSTEQVRIAGGNSTGTIGNGGKGIYLYDTTGSIIISNPNASITGGNSSGTGAKLGYAGSAIYINNGTSTVTLPDSYIVNLVPGTGITNGSKIFIGSDYFDQTSGKYNTLDEMKANPTQIIFPEPTVPDAPTAVTATAGNGQASVSFTAPSSDGGSSVTSYTVTSSPDGITATGVASPVLVTGLTNGTAYTFTVAATNIAGTGIFSAPSSAVTPVKPVTNITAVPTTGTVGTGLALSGTVAPTDATNKTIVWSVKSGTATMTGASEVTATAAGDVVVTATITNGLTASSNYTQDFTITFSNAYKAVTGISGVPTTGIVGTGLALSGTVAPTDATNKTIVWSVKSGTATMTGTSEVTATAAGDIVVTATITNGLTASSNYTQDFTITFSNPYKPVTGITGVPTTGTTGTEIDLTTATVNPSAATNKTIVWSVTDAGTTGVATSDLTTGKFTPASAGTLVLTATIANGATASTNYTQEVTITVVTPGTDIYSISADTALINFGSLTTGYASAPASRTVTITNTGNQSLSLTEPAATNASGNYTIGALSETVLDPGDTATFALHPKTGLAVGTYNETISVLGTSGAAASVSAQFSVTAADNGDSDGNKSHGGGSTVTTPVDPSDTPIKFNGQSENAGKTVTSTDGNKTVTTVTLDDAKIQEKIKTEVKGTVVSIPIGGSSDIGQGVLNGQTIKDMQKKESVLEIKTNGATYTLPAAEINIDSVSSQLGKSVELKDIKISVKIAEPSADTAKIVQNTADKNSYQVVVKPVDFEITCSNGSKTVSVSKFDGYVERTVAIPVGIDPSKVTTGIVLNSDGTFSHVPTTIVKIDGKYYAKINSLTNSTYSVIYNPVEFTDVAKHWAKASINNMGSRLVISGVGKDKFEPDRDITRAEFAAIMVRALGLAPDAAKNTFSDVSNSSWYIGYVGTAASYGIISGYDADTFAPNAKITREQAMTMVARAMAITKLDGASVSGASASLSGYADTAKISSYAKAGIIACLDTGVVTGKTANSIAPKNNITRAEVAVIIERLLKKSELI
jgi:hypothetical protein